MAKKLSLYMQPEISLSYPQENLIVPYFEPYEASLPPSLISLWDPF